LPFSESVSDFGAVQATMTPKIAAKTATFFGNNVSHRMFIPKKFNFLPIAQSSFD
jgi:hypothetical protein